MFFASAGGPVTYLQNNLGSFSTPASDPFLAYSGGTPSGTVAGTAMNVADFDGDGDLDIWGRNTGTSADFYSVNSGTPPRLISSTPVRNATNVIRSTNIALVFSKPVYAGTGSFQIRRISDNSILETIAANGAAVSGSGTTTIVINPLSTLLSTTTYYLTFNRTALADAQGIIAGSLSTNARTPASSPDFLSFTTSAVLPVTFGNLAAVLRNGELLVDWSTLTESSNDHFEIEASPNGQSFTVIGKTSSKAVGGNSSTTISYNFTRAVPGGLLAAGIFLAALAGFKLRSRRKNLVSVIMIALAAIVIFSACNKQSKDLVNSDNKIYIRVAQVDKDGTKSYSKVVTAQSE
ncbi:Ig-like domain-containing protein [Niabella hibiscisoli]|nr:Ig-like domain-containing protein [Niabella hibiscisoli]